MRALLLALLPAAALFAGCHRQQVYPNKPDLTGTLLVPVPQAVPLGHYTLISYLPTTFITGVYDNQWQGNERPLLTSISPQIYALVGLTKWMDIQIGLEFSENLSQGSASTVFNDLPVGLDIQLLWPESCSWAPGIKLFAFEVFPTGKYQHLSPHKHRTDVGGLGSFQTQIGLLLYKLIHLSGDYFMTTTLVFQETLFRHVRVHGLNAYAGGIDTRGIVHPGNSHQLFLSFEFNFTKHWEFVIDNVYIHQDSSTFTGNFGSGTTAGNTGANPGGTFIGKSSSDQLSMAPGIGYGFSPTFGVILGSWFTYTGRNSARFASAIFEIYKEF